MKNLVLPAVAALCAAMASAQTAGPSLAGVIDVHAHSNPDSSVRIIDALDLARLAKSRGMRGLLLKNHSESTAGIAYLVRKEVPGIEVFGGIVLNRTVGGVNPAAVEQMAQVTGGWGRVVWMPTRDAENQVRFSKADRPFVSVARNGELLPEVREVLKIMAARRLTLATGHSSPAESLLLIREAKRAGIERIIVTHPLFPAVSMSLEQMKQATSMGAYLEFVHIYHPSEPNPVPSLRDYVATIKAIGADHCILSSDMGAAGDPLHPDALQTFMQQMRDQGFSEGAIELMTKVNPAKLLGLE